MPACIFALFSSMVIHTTDFDQNHLNLIDFRDSIEVGQSAEISEIPERLAFGYKQFINRIPGLVVQSVMRSDSGEVIITVRRFQ